MPTIRQEINIIDTPYAPSNTGAIVQLDTTQYAGTAMYYFEVDMSANTGVTVSATLRRKGTTTDDATVSGTATIGVFNRYRSSAFTPPAGQTEYVITTTGSLATVNAARIIIIQNATTLTSTETQIEIGNEETAKTNTAAAALTNPKYWLYTAANWDGTLSFYAEVVWATSAKNTVTITLQEDDGSFGSWTNKVTIVSAGTGTVTRTRVPFGFTPTDGRHYRISALGSTTKSNYSIYCAKVIVDQSAAVTATYYFNASVSGPTDPDNAWSSDANAFDGSTSTSASVTDSVGHDLKGTGTTAPSGNSSAITQVAARIFGSVSSAALSTLGAAIDSSGVGLGEPAVFTTSPGWGASSILGTPSGGWDWTKLANLSVTINGHVAGSVTDNAYRVEIIVTYLDTSLAATKLEPQYLLLNTIDKGSVGFSGYRTLWDSTEWDGVTTTFKYAQDATNAADSSKLQDIDNGNADVTGATATGANQQISSAFTMPTTGHQIDVNVTNTTGVVGAGRILVACVVSVAAPPVVVAPVDSPGALLTGGVASDEGAFSF